jgi:hypothetical protein
MPLRWACAACTLDNEPGENVCDACGSPRPGADLIGVGGGAYAPAPAGDLLLRASPRLFSSCCWTDASFPASAASVGDRASAGVSLTFSSGRAARVPLVWRRPLDIADEDGRLASAAPLGGDDACARCRPSPSVDLPGALAAAAAAGGAGARDASFLAEQAARGGGARPVRAGGPPWALWRAGMSAADVAQGGLGDCWLVSALALVAEQPFRVRRLFVDAGGGSGDQPLLRGGAYRVRLCLRGVWTTVAVDDALPTSAWSGRLAFASCRRRQLWAPLIEKAAAKAAGSYAALVAGSTAEGLRMLTGAPVLTLVVASGLTSEERLAAGAAAPPPGEPPPPHVADALWARLASFADAGFLLGASASSPNDARLRAAGLVADHAYSILDLFHGEGRGGGLRLLRLRNPWSGGASRAWSGAWCDGSREWDAVPALRERLGPFRQADEGVFFMSFDDFVAHFSHVVVAKVRGASAAGDRTRAGAGGEHDPSREWCEARLRLRLRAPAAAGGGGGAAVARVVLPHARAAPMDLVVTFGGWAAPGEDVEAADDDAVRALYAGSGGLVAPVCGALGVVVVREGAGGGGAGGGDSGAGLAAAATGLALVRGSPARRMTASSLTAELDVDGGGGGELLVGVHDLAGASNGWVTLELHCPHPLLLERVARPAAWLGRALACVALTHGAPLAWRGGGASSSATAVVSWSDNGGVLIAAANLGAVDFEATTAVTAAAGGARTARPGHTRDVLRPAQAQLLQVLSACARELGAGAASLGTTVVSARTLPGGAGGGGGGSSEHSPPVAAGDLCAPFASASPRLPAFLLP